jgi:hypothetical protein
VISPTRTGAARPPTSGGQARTGWTVSPAADSVWWIVGVAAAFSAAQLVFVAPHLGLSWDEAVYVSQLSIHAPAANLDPARARGVSLLAAPVTMLTSSILALRVYLSLLSGTGLLLALLAWRRLRPAWLLALAGACYASLWTAQYYGPQAMPDEWVAFSVFGAVGLFLRASGAGEMVPAGPAPSDPAPSDPAPSDPAPSDPAPSDPAPSDPALRTSQRAPVPRVLRGRHSLLAGLAACLAIAALVRPGDALYVGAALGIAVLAVPRFRQPSLLAAVVLGFAAGAAEWVVEAYVRYGGLLARLHAAAAEQGGFAVYAGWWAELRALNGPTLCRPCTVSLRDPVVDLWWLALPVIVALGVLAAHRAGRLASSALAACCGLAVGFQYLVLVNYAAPRFLLPAYLLLAIPVADALGFLVAGVAGAQVRPAGAVLVGVALLGQLMVQQVVLAHQVGEKTKFFNSFTQIADDLHGLGVRPPCLVKGAQDIPLAYDAGCASTPTIPLARQRHARVRIAYLVRSGQTAPPYVQHWPMRHLAGVRSDLLPVTAYVAPGKG